jgi:hypothetical protein
MTVAVLVTPPGNILPVACSLKFVLTAKKKFRREVRKEKSRSRGLHPTRCAPGVAEKSSVTTSKELYEFDNPEGIRPMYEKTTESFCRGH